MSLSRKVLACLTAALLMLVMLSVAVAQDFDGVEEDFMEGVVRVTGKGYGMQKYSNVPGKFRLTAEKAARMDAQGKLAEFIEARVETNARMTAYEVDEYTVSVAAKGVVRNAKEVGTAKHFEDGHCEVVMEMPLFGGKGSIAEVAYLPFKDEPKVSFPQPSMNVSQPSGANYTGLIIECSGAGTLNPVMSPVIKNSNGQEIYGHKNLNYDKIIIQGMASYANSSNDQISQSRAGSNPLRVKAIRLDDLSANPVVSVEDADKILAANQHDKFLENCAVVFVK